MSCYDSKLCVSVTVSAGTVTGALGASQSVTVNITNISCKPVKDVALVLQLPSSTSFSWTPTNSTTPINTTDPYQLCLGTLCPEATAQLTFTTSVPVGTPAGNYQGTAIVLAHHSQTCFVLFSFTVNAPPATV